MSETSRPVVSDVEFIRAWETVVSELRAGTVTGKGAEIVAERIGLQPTSVTQRAGRLRKEKGVALSHMPKGRGQTTNTELQDELAKIRAELSGETQSENVSDQSPNEGETDESQVDQVDQDETETSEVDETETVSV